MGQRRALITGITGQDGSYLAELLLEKGYEVHGLVRRTSTHSMERISHIEDRLVLHLGDVLHDRSVINALREAQPDEPPHWLVYFSVEDPDKSSAQAQEFGGSLTVPPMDFPGGRFAIVADPHGSNFGLMFLRS